MSSEHHRPRRGLLLAISSPSGAGKTSLSRRLLADHPDLHLSVSYTTRAPRSRELEGREYHFVDRGTFLKLAEEGAFLEWAEVHDNCYGTPRQPVMEALQAGRDVLFDIDWQGARQIAAQVSPSDMARVFILPPSIADLRRRLYARGQDEPEVIEFRLKRAKEEIAHWNEYEHVIVNEDFDQAYAELAHIYHAARLTRPRNPWLNPLVEQLLDEQF